MASFNVLTDPWIPTIDASGKITERGIVDTLLQAHSLVGISDPAPPIEFGIYRLLIAFVMDAYQLRTLDQLEDLVGAGAFDGTVIDDYVATVGRERFDLFDVNHPFLQSPPEEGIGEKPDLVVRLFQHLPSGTFATHFHHASEDSHAICPADCVRGLVTIAPFMTAGGAGYSPSVNGAPPWYVLVRGRNLFETICLNCYVLDPRLYGEPPAWRSTVRVGPKEERKCSSLLEALTWRPRRVRLIPGEGGQCTYCGRSSFLLVRQMVFSFGFKSAGGWIDPQVAYRYDNEGPSPLRPREDRELWRDTGPLMLLTQKDYESDNGRVRYQRPFVVQQLSELRRDGAVPPEEPLILDVYGMRTDMKMKIFEWQQETLALPSRVAENPRAGSLVQQALEAAEEVSFALGVALKRAYPRQGSGNDKALGNLITSARQVFWTALRLRFEQDFIGILANQGAVDATAEAELRRVWNEALRECGTLALEGALEQLDSDAKALRRQVEARSFFAMRLRLQKVGTTRPKTGARRENA